MGVVFRDSQGLPCGTNRVIAVSTLRNALYRLTMMESSLRAFSYFRDNGVSPKVLLMAEKMDSASQRVVYPDFLVQSGALFLLYDSLSVRRGACFC